MRPETAFPIIAGPDLFDIEVVGESRFIDNLINACGPLEGKTSEVIVRACLTLEDTTVAISVDGHPIGHAAAATAMDFRRAVIAGGLSEYTNFMCNARIDRWLNPHEDHERFGIWLDLPQDNEHQPADEIASRAIQESLIHVYRRGAVADRQIDELIGIVKGVLADGVVTQGEVMFLLRWMETNRHAANLWPAKTLYPRLAEVLAKGAMSLQDEGVLLEMLLKTIGRPAEPNEIASSKSTRLPFDETPGRVTFDSRAFCFTGVFHSGTRDWCHSQVAHRGGRGAGTITKKLDYLVIGDIGNENWAHSTHGRKIEKAIAYNSSGSRIVIVSEEHWFAHL
jgi:hypothetical protein